MANGTVLQRFLADEQATVRLGEDLALALKAGDVLALHGDLGAGKTALARAIIRALAVSPDLEVPSPTFTLVQSYEARLPVQHFDLYRLASPEELDELGFDEAAQAGVAIVEWPERAGHRLPPSAIHVELEQRDEGRLASLRAPAELLGRLRRTFAVRDFLDRHGWGSAHRAFLQGDASTRAYETVMREGEAPRILMNAPKQPDGPPIRDGKPYSRIAHLAESVTPFVALAKALRRAGFSAPELYAADLDQGLLMLEHLGESGFLDGSGNPVAHRYAAAAELLASARARNWPAALEAAPGVIHQIPPYDRGAMMIEVELVVDWYLPAITGRPVTEAHRTEFTALWNEVFDRVERAEKSLILRDFHSPNLIWRENLKGMDRVGILDFQDALIGPSTYDLASLAMDARVTISPDLERATVQAYKQARARDGAAHDGEAFDEAYAIMAAQRNSKILGIFVRLDRRDGKPHYLKHLPRIRDYAARALEHPALANLRAFYLRHGLIGERA
jgi:tRNA threonylcarbamoyl adenosine modification protein YjeE